MCEYPSVSPPTSGSTSRRPIASPTGWPALPHSPTSCFTPERQAYAAGQERPIEHLAARFAAKEAVIKALGLDGFDPLDIEVIDGGERCDVRLHGEAAQRADDLDVTVSISLTHVGALAGAIALARPRTAT